VGIRACADGEYIAQLNDDCAVVTNGWLAKMVETMQLSPDIALVGPKVVMFDGTIFSAGVSPKLRGLCLGEKDYGQREFVEEVTALTGACYLYRRSALSDLRFESKRVRQGGYTRLKDLYDYPYFDEKYVLGSAFSDTDLCLRLRKRGWRIFYDGRVKVIHHKQQTQGRWYSWNHIYFHAKHPGTIIGQWL